MMLFFNERCINLLVQFKELFSISLISVFDLYFGVIKHFREVALFYYVIYFLLAREYGKSRIPLKFNYITIVIFFHKMSSVVNYINIFLYVE